jgi:hypothetical protein
VDQRQMKMVKWAPCFFWAFAVISVISAALWVISIFRHDTDWFELGFAVVWGLMAGYYGRLIYHH